jgi:hypothetical protein
MTGSEADDETDDHAREDRYDSLMYRTYSVHLEIIRGEQREEEQYTNDKQ